jgi:hypothetical protein
MAVSPALQTYFSDGGSPAIESTEPVDDGNLRITFNDGHVSDWRVTTDEDGVVTDAYCYNDVI